MEDPLWTPNGNILFELSVKILNFRYVPVGMCEYETVDPFDAAAQLRRLI